MEMTPVAKPRSRTPSNRSPQLNGCTPELLENAERLLEKLNKRPRDVHVEQKQQLKALIKLLKDPLFQQVYKANLAVDEATMSNDLIRSRGRFEPQFETEDVISVVSEAPKTLQKSPAMTDLASAVESERGFVRADESIEEFVDRVKGSRRIHTARFYRDPGTSLGFSVNKVTADDIEFEAVVNEVRVNGLADQEGIRVGDQILVVNKVMLRTSDDIEESLDILKSPGTIEIILAQNTREMTKVQTQTQFYRFTLQNDANGLGFGIIASDRKILIERIIPNTPAALSGCLKIGDEMLEICGKNVVGYRIEDIHRELNENRYQEVEIKTKRVVPLSEEFYAEGDVYDVTIETNEKGMGLSVNSPLDKSSTSGVTIKSVVPDSPAEKVGVIGSDDRIVVVNGITIFGETGEFSMNKLRNAGKTVHLTLMRPAIKTPEVNINPSVSDIPTNKRETKDAEKKWQQILGPNYKVLVEEISKFDPKGGWGFSLEGLELEEPSGELIYRHFFKVIAESGPVGRSGNIKEGDELLEVLAGENSREVRGLLHAEAVKMLSSIPVKVHFVVGRRLQAQSEVIQDFDAEFSSFLESVNRGFEAEPAEIAAEEEDIIVVDKNVSQTENQPESFFPAEDKFVDLKDVIWSWEVSEAYITKSPFEDLGISLTQVQKGPEKHVIIDQIDAGSPASKTSELKLYDKVITVQGKSIVGRSLEEVRAMLEDSSSDSVMIGVRKCKYKDEMELESQESESLASSVSSAPPPQNLQLDEPELVLEAQKTTYATPDKKLYKETGPSSVSASKDIKLHMTADRETVIAQNDSTKLLPDTLQQKIAVSKLHVGVVGLSVGKETSGNGVIVKSTLPGGAVARDGRIEVGDIIREINDINIRSMDINDVRGMLRELGRKEDDVFLTYITREDAQYFWSFGSIPNPLTVKSCLFFEGMDPEFLARSNSSMLQVKKNPVFSTPSTDTIKEANANPVDENPIYSPQNPFKESESKRLPSFSAARDEQGIALINETPDHDSFLFGPKRLVEIVRNEGEPLGLSILGHEMGIFIKDVIKGSPAAGNPESSNTDDLLNSGDRLISVNGQNLMNCSQQEAVLLIKRAKSPLRFIVQSCTVKGERNETLFSSIN